MDPEHIRIAVDIGTLIMVAGNFIYVSTVARRKATKESIDAVASLLAVERQRIDQVKEEELSGRLRHDDIKSLKTTCAKVEVIESRLDGMPHHTDLAAVHEKVNRVATSMANIRGELQAITRTLALIHETLMHGVNKP